MPVSMMKAANNVALSRAKLAAATPAHGAAGAKLAAKARLQSLAEESSVRPSWWWKRGWLAGAG